MHEARVKNERRIVLVTGAGRGIGCAIAHGFAGEGAVVIVADIDGASARSTADAIRAAGGEAHSYEIDVSREGACLALAETIAMEVGTIDVLINNAGIGGELGLDDPQSRALWDRQMAVNATGVFDMIRAFVPALRETRGTIVSLASVASFTAVTRAYGYMASKAAVKMLTQTFAKVLAEDGIRVNAVAPGTIRTELTAARLADPAWSGPFLVRVPLGRAAEPDEVVRPILFLSSTAASYITGVTLPVDGGFLAV